MFSRNISSAENYDKSYDPMGALGLADLRWGQCHVPARHLPRGEDRRLDSRLVIRWVGGQRVARLE